tara:strand:+ start:1578 stop:3473 length:1896 start_codon:yes stop_codon:yes gene_type:complete
MPRFILFTLIIFVFSLFTVGSFNILYKENLLSDIFNKKIKFNEDRRIINPLILRIHKPKCILTGTSRVARGFGPENIYLKEKYCLNLYFNAGNINEINQFLKLALRHNTQEIFLGLDFFSFNNNYSINQYQSNFNPYNFKYDNVFIRILNNLDKIFSLRNLRDIIKEKKYFNSDNTHYKLDEIYEITYDQTNRKRNTISLVDDRYIKALGIYKYFDSINKGHGLSRFKLNKNGLIEFLNILNDINLTENKIYIFMSPVHNYLIDAIYHKKLDKDYYRIIKEISEKINNKNTYFYDFSNYNFITSGLSENKKFVNGYYLDFGHYSKEVGDLIINEFLFHKDVFGIKVNKNNFLNYLEQVKLNRSKWLKNNPLDDYITRNSLNCKNELCVENLILDSFNLNSDDYLIDNKVSTPISSEILIPKGNFYFGLKDIHRTSNGSVYEVKYLDSYYIDSYEVTNKEYYITNEESDLIGINDQLLEDLPVTGITFEEAKKHCERKNKRLPTEEEWEKAVKNDKYIRYSWGNKFPICNLATFNGDKGIGCGKEKRNKDNTMYGNLTSKVKTNKNGRSVLGVYNLIGNVWEYVDTKNNNEDAITKGGGWSTELIGLNSSSRYYISKDSRASNVGFRCARDF